MPRAAGLYPWRGAWGRAGFALRSWPRRAPMRTQCLTRRARFHYGRPRARQRRLRQRDISMIDLYFWPTSNNKKITIMLHEVGLPYRLELVNFIKGENYRAEFLALNPNAKT